MNTVPVPAEVSLMYKERYVYSCLPGYKLADENMNTVTTCMANGMFSMDVLPTCTGKNNRYLCYIVSSFCIIRLYSCLGLRKH